MCTLLEHVVGSSSRSISVEIWVCCHDGMTAYVAHLDSHSLTVKGRRIRRMVQNCWWKQFSWHARGAYELCTCQISFEGWWLWLNVCNVGVCSDIFCVNAPLHKPAWCFIRRLGLFFYVKYIYTHGRARARLMLLLFLGWDGCYIWNWAMSPDLPRHEPQVEFFMMLKTYFGMKCTFGTCSHC